MEFNIARYYFTTLFREQGHKNFLDDLRKEPYIERDKFTYALGSFEVEESDDKTFSIIRGQFGKIRNEDSVLRYNKENKEFITQDIHDTTEEVIHFFIQHDQHLLFIQKSSELNAATAQKIFKEIYNKNSSVKADIEIDYIFDECDVYEAIRQWHRVTKVKFKDLRPSNPSSSDTFANIENLIKETKSSKTNLQFEAEEKTERGENKLDMDSTLIKEALALSANGYGSAEIRGEQDGEVKTVKTQRFIKQLVVDFNEDGQIEKIKKTVEEISKFEYDK